MSETPHLLDEHDETHFEEQTGQHSPFRRWASTWFPFHARVQKSPGDWDFAWDLSLAGGAYAFERGKSETRAEAFRAVADAKRDALVKLRDQIEALEREPSRRGGEG